MHAARWKNAAQVDKKDRIVVVSHAELQARGPAAPAPAPGQVALARLKRPLKESQNDTKMAPK